MTNERSPRILILGGGYGGLECALQLQKNLPAGKADITLVNKHDYHYQTTLLHKVAIGTLGSRKARIFYRKILDLNKINFIKDKVVSLHPDENKVVCCRHTFEYDYLVVGLGFKAETFSIPGAKENSYQLSSLNASIELARIIENKFKDYVITQNELDLHTIVCGAGLTSIEFAAELATQLDDLCTICGIDRNLPKITCIGRENVILPMFSAKTSERAMRKLESLGVTLLTGTEVVACNPDGVRVRYLATGEEADILGSTTIWGAGVSGPQIIQDSQFENRRGRVVVDEYLRTKQYPNVFMVGDSGIASDQQGEIPPTAQLANQMGAYVARYLANTVQGKPVKKPFHFNHKGTVCSLGHTDGVAEVYHRPIQGEFAAFIKNLIENKWLMKVGGLGLVLKKGQFRYRTSN